MVEATNSIVKDSKYGFFRLDPIPSDEELTKYYQSKYYHILRKGDRAPQIARLLADGADADVERQWLSATVYDDVADILDNFAPGRRALDVGCGIGELISDLRLRGFEMIGIEPSHEAAKHAQGRGLSVICGQLTDIVAQSKHNNESSVAPFDAVLFMNVLEHAPDPARLVIEAKTLLAKNGVVIVRVPNDFSELQALAARAIGRNQWWVVSPDHINYFSFASLSRFLEKMGLTNVYMQSDFPMELFLLMGDDYISNPSIGANSHIRRRRLELSMPSNLRRTMYRAFANQGIGRTCLLCARVAS